MTTDEALHIIRCDLDTDYASKSDLAVDFLAARIKELESENEKIKKTIENYQHGGHKW